MSDLNVADDYVTELVHLLMPFQRDGEKMADTLKRFLPGQSPDTDPHKRLDVVPLDEIKRKVRRIKECTKDRNGELADAIGQDLIEAYSSLSERIEGLERDNGEMRQAFEKIFPASEGYTEAMDELILLGLLVEVPADEAFKEQWGEASTMYVWRWSELASLKAGKERA